MANGGIVRIGSFNVENLFSRARVFTEDDQATGSAILSKIAELQRLLEAPTYQKSQIVKLYNDAGLDRYISIRCDRVIEEGAATRFFNDVKSGKATSVNAAIDGPNDWVGAIEFKRDDLDEPSKVTLGRVIRNDLKADVLCLCEVEDRRTLQDFNDGMLGGLYPYNVLIEGNDPRGIDVALLSTFPIGAVRTNIFTKDPFDKLPSGAPAGLFSRDCLEVEIELPGAAPITVLCNHFKSKSGDETASDPKRLRQSREIAKLLKSRYQAANGTWRRQVVIAGDLNESAARNGQNGSKLEGLKSSIDPLLKVPGLHDALGSRLPIGKRFTYEFAGQKQQIDYLLLSSQLNQAVTQCGAVYTGRFTDGINGILEPLAAASDHAAIWVDVKIPGLVHP